MISSLLLIYNVHSTHAGLDPVSDNVDADRIPDEVFEAAARAPAAGYRDSDDEDDSMDFEA